MTTPNQPQFGQSDPSRPEDPSGSDRSKQGPLARKISMIAMIFTPLLVGVVLLRAFDVVETEQFLILIVALVAIQSVVLMRTLTRERRRALQGTAPIVDRKASTVDGTEPGKNEGYDPMEKFR